MFKRLYREFFYVPKYEKMTDKVFKGRIGLSVLTMLLCCVLFCATTFAWFTSQQNSPVNPIVAADYSLSVDINGRTLDTNKYTCPLAMADEHKFIITATGTATTGYCEITVNGQTYTTVSIPKETSITLTIVAAQGEEIIFSAHWGVSTGEGTYYCDGAVIEISNTPHQRYTVVEGITLEQIAEHYKVSASDILLYNGISKITVGTEIKIPNTAVTEPLVISEDPTEDMTEPTEDITEPTDEPTAPADDTIEETTEPTVAATEPAADSEQEPTEDETTPTEPAQTENTEPSESAEPTEQSDVETRETQQTE